MSRLKAVIDIELPKPVKASMVANLAPGQNLADWIAVQAIGNALSDLALSEGSWIRDDCPCDVCGGLDCYVRSMSDDYLCTDCESAVKTEGE